MTTSQRQPRPWTPEPWAPMHSDLELAAFLARSQQRASVIAVAESRPPSTDERAMLRYLRNIGRPMPAATRKDLAA